MDDNDETDDNGLGVGAKAGMGVGVSLGSLFILGIAYLLIRRKRRGNTEEGGTGVWRAMSHRFIKKKEESGAGIMDKTGPMGLPGGPGKLPPAELGADATRSELEGAGTGEKPRHMQVEDGVGDKGEKKRQDVVFEMA